MSRARLEELEPPGRRSESWTLVHAPGSGSGVRVCVIDSGWDRTLNDPRVERGVGFNDPTDDLTLLFSDDDQDRNGHGTAVIDLLLQTSPGVSVVPVKVFGQGLETAPAILLAAVEWAFAQGLRVIHLSLGSRRPDILAPLYRVCERASRDGAVIVAAGGNSSSGWSYPAVFEPVIGVGTHVGSPHFDVRFHPDAALDCTARPDHLVRTLGGRLTATQATSFAAPVVTGCVGRLLASTPSIRNVRELRDVMAAGGRPESAPSK
jgi:subtilisin